MQAGLLTEENNKDRGEENSPDCNGPVIKRGRGRGRRSFNKQKWATSNLDTKCSIQDAVAKQGSR